MSTARGAAILGPMRALLAALLLLPLGPSPAFGEGLRRDAPVVMRLRYARAAGAEACPDEAFFRDVVVGVHVRHGDPFAADAPRLLTVLVSRRGGGYESFGELRDDATGAVLFTKGYPPTPRCVDALGDLARGIAIAIERPEVRGRADACPAAPLSSSMGPSAPPPACYESRFAVWPAEGPSPKPPPDPPRERGPIAVRLGFAVWPEIVASGWGSLGLTADAGVRYSNLSASVEMHGDPPLGSVAYTGVGPVSFARLSGALLLCAHWEWFVGCGVADVGRFIFPHHVNGLPASAVYAAAGARVGLDFPVLPPRLFLRTAVDLRAPLHQMTYPPNVEKTVFGTAGLGFGLGLGLVVELSP